jgi:hypothetical protein
MRIIPRTQLHLHPAVSSAIEQCPITSRDVAWVAGGTVPITWLIGATTPDHLMTYGLTATVVYSTAALGRIVWELLPDLPQRTTQSVSRGAAPAESATPAASADGGPDGTQRCDTCPNPATRRFVHSASGRVRLVCDVHTPGPDAPPTTVHSTPVHTEPTDPVHTESGSTVHAETAPAGGAE